jgi:GntR family transcriptional repressor for pyruvate dehydrogenase complex
LERTSLIDSIVTELIDKITAGDLKPGDMLAPQDHLAKSMGVSRASLREALNRLSLMGLIETRQGAGTFVKSATPSDFMNPLTSFVILDQISAEELLDARLHIESAVAALAATHATLEDIAKLRFLLEGMKKDFRSNNSKSFIARDVQFHVLIAETSKNRVLVKVVEIIRGLLRQFIKKFFEAMPSSMNDAIRYHENIFNAIQQHDPVAAKRHMEEHILSLIDRSKDSLQW